MTTMNKTPLTLKGFRDFLPEEKRKRDWVEAKIVEAFELFGFEPLETPTLEYASLLKGKYGDEADKLLYTFADRGDREVGLRYDQTVPTARVLGQYQNELPKYFRRYQLQNVFRADKPQKGRYREFAQCDIDIFGSTSPISDAEILACTFQAYANIGFNDIKLMVNDRVTLMAMLEPYASESINVFSIIQTLDKLDKLAPEAVIAELTKKGLSQDSSEQILQAVNQAKISQQLALIIEAAVNLGVPRDNLVFSPALARGLDYYTGMIFEVKVESFAAGSLGGGGRYDKLLNDLTGVDLPAVGMAFGFDRTVEAAEQLGLIPSQQSTAQVLVTVFNSDLQKKSLQTATLLRQAGVKTEIFPGTDKLPKQFKLADQKKIPFVVIIGETEIENNQVTLKVLTTGQQETLRLDQVIDLIEFSSRQQEGCCGGGCCGSC